MLRKKFSLVCNDINLFAKTAAVATANSVKEADIALIDSVNTTGRFKGNSMSVFGHYYWGEGDIVTSYGVTFTSLNKFIVAEGVW